MTRQQREERQNAIYGEHHEAAAFPDDYRNLANIINLHGKDIRFRRAAEYYDTAKDYARRRNLVLGPEDEDIDHDGENDVVLYDYSNRPVIINGYELVPSERPYRQAYLEHFPTKLARAEVDGYTGFKRSFYDDAERLAWMNALPTKFARIKPPRQRVVGPPSLYKRFSDNVREVVYEKINALTAGKTHAKTLISPFQVISIMYLHCVLRTLWTDPANASIKNEICEKYDDTTKIDTTRLRYEAFKKYIAKNRATMDAHYDRRIDDIRNDALNDDNFLAALGAFNTDMLAELPTDAEIDNAKRTHDYAFLHEVKVAKARMAEIVETSMEATRSQLLNFIFSDTDEADVADSNYYIQRLQATMTSLLRMPREHQVSALGNLIRLNRRIFIDFGNFMERNKTPENSEQIDSILSYMHRLQMQY